MNCHVISLNRSQYVLYSLSVLTAILSRWPWFSRYWNVSILEFIGAKVDGVGGDNWS